MTRALQAQFKAHWSKILIAIAVASVTIITKTGDAVATRIEQMIFEKSVTNTNITEAITKCKQRDSSILAIHAVDMGKIAEAINAISESNKELSHKIDVQSAKLDGLIEGVKFRNSIGYVVDAANDSTKPCNITVYAD